MRQRGRSKERRQAYEICCNGHKSVCTLVAALPSYGASFPTMARYSSFPFFIFPSQHTHRITQKQQRNPYIIRIHERAGMCIHFGKQHNEKERGKIYSTENTYDRKIKAPRSISRVLFFAIGECIPLTPSVFHPHNPFPGHSAFHYISATRYMCENFAIFHVAPELFFKSFPID